MNIRIQDVQAALVARGYNLAVDGINGRLTQAAIADFQARQALPIKYPGTLGPITYAALGMTSTDPGAPPWVEEARRFVGLHERRDAAQLDRVLGLNARETAWCGAFVAMVISTALPHEPLPANPLGARQWLKFGKPIDGPQIGAVAVFWRGSRDGWQGHVGFVVGHDAQYLHILGGNQSHMVSVSRLDKARLLGYRWPTTTGAAPTAALPTSTIAATITTNEA